MPDLGTRRGKTIIALLRIPQWVKNGFVLAPLFFGFQMSNGAVVRATTAFFVFCLVSSAIYIFNDWHDLKADGGHPWKRFRPLPSGAVSVQTALRVMIGLLTAAIVITLASDMPIRFFATLAVYVAVNIGYSLGLKQISLLEIFLVASGLVLRLLAGAFVVEIEPSSWIIVVTAMLALLLTAGKRRGEIASGNSSAIGRKSLVQYNVPYLDAVIAALTGGTLVIYLLFCISDYAVARYGRSVLITAVPVALGLLRYLQLVMVQGQGESPTSIMLRDSVMIVVLVSFILMFVGLIYYL